MGNPLYAVRENAMGICPGCKFRTDSPSHYRIHIPRSKWPQEMQAPRKRRVVVNGLVLDADDPRAHGEPAWQREPFAAPMGGIEAVSGEASAPGSHTLPEAVDAGVSPSPEAATIACICGREARSNAGLAAHQRHCEQFKAVSASG